MNPFNLSLNPFLFLSLDIDQFSEIKSYNYISKYINNPWPLFFDKNSDQFKIYITSYDLNFNDINEKFKEISGKRENKIQIDIKMFNESSYLENENQIDNSFSLLYYIQEKTKNNSFKEVNNSKNSNNSKINIEINNNYEEKKEIRKKIFKVVHSNNLNESKNFNIFSNGNYDNFSCNIINETLNDVNKNCKKVKNKKIITCFPKKIKKKKKNIQKRKDNSDNIRKKIKSRFLKALKNAINQKLKHAGSKYYFSLLPQSFIINLSKEKNKEILELPLKNIFLKNFNDKEKGKRADLNKYKHNQFVLNYLEKNNDISEKSNFNKIKNMKYYEIFNEYLLSKEFELEISTLKKEKENDKYIKDYIIKAKNFIFFFYH